MGSTAGYPVLNGHKAIELCFQIRSGTVIPRPVWYDVAFSSIVVEVKHKLEVKTHKRHLMSWSHAKSIVRVWAKIDRVITEPHCIFDRQNRWNIPEQNTQYIKFTLLVSRQWTEILMTLIWTHYNIPTKCPVLCIYRANHFIYYGTQSKIYYFVVGAQPGTTL